VHRGSLAGREGRRAHGGGVLREARPVSGYQEMRLRQVFSQLQPVRVSDELIRESAVSVARLFRRSPRSRRRSKG
jgi:hypothetical protein